MADCTHPDLVTLAGHIYPLATADGCMPVPVLRACPACGFAANGIKEGRLQTHDVAELVDFVEARKRLHDAIKNGTNANAATDAFPSPIWLPRLGLVPTVSPDLIAPLHRELTEAEVRTRIRGHFGRAELNDEAIVHSPKGDIVVNEIYENHFFDVDPLTGLDRRDEDHLTYAALTRDTIERPIEVWLVQRGGVKSRRLAFFKLYMAGEKFVYHLAIITLSRHLLTAHRLGGGMGGFQSRRVGVPVYAAY